MIEKEFQVDGSGELDVRFSSGRLQVKEGSPGKIIVTVDGRTDDLILEQTGSVVSIGNRKSGFLSSSRYHMSVEVPPGCDVSANVASADVQCECELGRLNVNSASGDVRFTKADEVTTRTASGDVHGSVTRLCSFVSASGDLHLDRTTGKTTASTASGDIYINEVEADFSCSSLSGDVNIRKFGGDDLKAKAVAGNVRIGIPAGTAVNLDATTRSGAIRLPDPSPGQSEPTGHADISVSLVSGDLTIKRV